MGVFNHNEPLRTVLIINKQYKKDLFMEDPSIAFSGSRFKNPNEFNNATVDIA